MDGGEREGGGVCPVKLLSQEAGLALQTYHTAKNFSYFSLPFFTYTTEFLWSIYTF